MRKAARLRSLRRLVVIAGACTSFAAPAAAQQAQTASTVLAFLLQNRSISTGDFQRDQQAAAATGDAIATFLRSELGAVPINAPASGFTYRLDPTLGVNVRTSDSFGPFYTVRSLTSGRHQVSFSVGYSQSHYDNIDGRTLRTGTLVVVASQLQSDTQPFDVETLTLRVQTRTTTFAAHWGVTDRFDLSAVAPFVTMTLSGDRVDTYRGTPFPQASGAAAASGLGDVVIRGKYNIARSGPSGIAVAADVRLPTGDAANLLGAGQTVVTPRIVGSLEHQRLGLHGDVGYGVGAGSRELDYNAAVTLVGGSRVTIVAEALGRRLSSGGQLVDAIEPRPGLVGVNTIRLTGTTQSTSRLSIVAGIRWNVGSRWLLSLNVLRPMTTAGLNAKWIPTMTFDYSIGR